MKQDCPFCGKQKVDGRHRNLCSKNPKNMSESVPEVATPFFEPIVAPSEIPTPEIISEVRTLNCPTCGAKSIMLNALDYRCPNCGDREKRQPLPAGVK